jgi:hypothetical protein
LLEVGEEGCVGLGFEPGLGDREGFGGTRTVEVGFVEADDDPEAGEFIDGPEGAEDVLGAGFEAGAGEADVFEVGVGGAGDAGFAGGEADEGVGAEVELGELFGGEGLVGEADRGLVRVAGIVAAVAGEVEDALVGLEGL